MSKWFEILYIEMFLTVLGARKLFFRKWHPKFDFWNLTFLDLKLTKNEKKNIFFSHQIKGNAIISSNHKGQVIISNGFIFTAIFIFGILKSANQLAKYEYFSKMEKNLHIRFILQEFHVLLMKMIQKILRTEIKRSKTKF